MTQFKKPLFLDQINMLKNSSKETVVNANTFEKFPEYMHTQRKIEEEIIKAITQLPQKKNKQLILLAGSVGDGKSHLLSYIKANYSEVFQLIDVHNDATESHDPEESSIETLEKKLQAFNDGHIAQKHVIIAINLGVLHNFIQRQISKQQFKALSNFIKESGVFHEKAKSVIQHEQFQLYNFASDRIFFLNEEGAHSPFLEEILHKIVANHPDNPIYHAWKHDIDGGNSTMAHLNYQLLQSPGVQRRVLEKLYHVMLLDKVLLSTRAFYHFIYTIIVPSLQEMDESKTCFGIEHTLPNLLFNHPERTALLNHIHKIDPLNLRNRKTDELVTNLHILKDKWAYMQEHLRVNDFDGTEDGNVTDIYERIFKNALASKDILALSKLVVRTKNLLEPTIYTTYNEFLSYLYSYYCGETKNIMPLFAILKEAFIKWKGSPKKNYYFVTNDVTKAYRLALPIRLREEAGLAFGKMKNVTEVRQFENFMTIGYGSQLFELDLHLYELLKRVQDGYRPNALELDSAIQFEDFYKQLINQSEREGEELLIVQTKERIQYIVSKPGFSLSDAKFNVEEVK